MATWRIATTSILEGCPCFQYPSLDVAIYTMFFYTIDCLLFIRSLDMVKLVVMIPPKRHTVSVGENPGRWQCWFQVATRMTAVLFSSALWSVYWQGGIGGISIISSALEQNYVISTTVYV
jgi:hypothetical protein